MSRRPTVGFEEIVQDLKSAFEAVRAEVTQDYTAPISERAEHALAHLETFAAIAVRVMRDTNPSRLREAARTEEIKARIEGREVLE